MTSNSGQRGPARKHLLLPIYIGLLGIFLVIAGVFAASQFGPSAVLAQEAAEPGHLPTVPAPTQVAGQNPFREVVKQVKPAVVNITTMRPISAQTGMDPQSPFMFPMPSPEMSPFSDEEGTLAPSSGSGFIVDPTGYIITNNHVIESAVSIEVTLDDGRRLEAELVGTDPQTDIALLKLTEPTTDIPFLSLGNSEEVEIGDWVIAVGSPLGLEQTVTVGVVSAKNRDQVELPGQSNFQDFIQTDAAINFGNSGGPLLTIDGRVIGMNTAIAGGMNVSGIGFAVPANKIRFVYENLLAHGEVRRGYLGVLVQPVSPSMAEANGITGVYGAQATEVDPTGPAGQAGLEPGDIILEINGHRVLSSMHMVNLVSESGVDATLNLRVIRNKAEKTLTMRTAKRPESPDIASIPTTGGSSAPQGIEQREELVMDEFGLKVAELTAELREQLGVPDDTRGVLVEAVKQGSEPYNEGMNQDDIIVTVNGIETPTVGEFQKQIDAAKGSFAQIHFKRQTRSRWGSYIVAVEVP